MQNSCKWIDLVQVNKNLAPERVLLALWMGMIQIWAVGLWLNTWLFCSQNAFCYLATVLLISSLLSPIISWYLFLTWHPDVVGTSSAHCSMAFLSYLKCLGFRVKDQWQLLMKKPFIEVNFNVWSSFSAKVAMI